MSYILGLSSRIERIITSKRIIPNQILSQVSMKRKTVFATKLLEID